jgi:hypothetical protein
MTLATAGTVHRDRLPGAPLREIMGAVTGVSGVLLLVAGISLWLGVTLALWKREVRREQRRLVPDPPPPGYGRSTVADEAQEWLSRH